ncbi:response regulator [Roseomonas sp. M0104]|uniref:histidine kinase n=1 Tax=Teichococcus coralli TaxID=2545983 RepID=A0A845BFV0_9PROT|nr:ATP-binding protein [Pseudoroseomonas coralli]MXP62359.1 response regulator [Pseudoroseomonas coralli]
MHLDTTTLLLLSAVLGALLGAIWLGLSLHRHRTTGLGEWGTALLCLALGTMLLGARGALPDLLSIDIGNLVILLGGGFCWRGARRFDGRTAPAWIVLLPGLLWLAAMRMPAREFVEYRVVVASVLSGLPMLAIAWEFWRGRPEGLACRMLLSGGFALHGGLTLLRIPVMLLQADWTRTSVLPDNVWVQIILLESILHGVGTSFALLALFRERGERQLLEATAASRDAAQQASAAKSRFLAWMSHEMRTPLNGVLGLSQVLSENRSLQPSAQEQVAVIAQAGQHLLALVNDVLDLALVEAGRLTLQEAPVPLGVLRENTLALVRPEAARKGIRLRTDIAPDLPANVRGDGRRLQQILLNLLANAVKFTPRGGEVCLSMQCWPDGSLRLAVTDTGPGISATQRALLFRDFTRLPGAAREAAQEGYGLGLAISAALVQAMQGTLGVDAGPEGRGSRFWVHLSLPHAPAEATGAAAPAAAPVRDVLVVDDVAVNRMVVQALLQSGGHVVRQAASGEAALALLAERGAELVLMDLQMPGMDGVETARRIRKQEAQEPGLPRTIIIALTGELSEEAQEACRAAGMDGCLAKPVSRANLYAVLRGMPAPDPSAPAAGATPAKPVHSCPPAPPQPPRSEPAAAKPAQPA